MKQRYLPSSKKRYRFLTNIRKERRTLSENGQDKSKRKSSGAVVFTFYTSLDVATQLEELYHKLRLKKGLLYRGKNRVTRSAIISTALKTLLEEIKKPPKGIERRKAYLHFYEELTK